MKKILLCFVLFLSASVVLCAQENKEYEAAMVKMLEVSRSMDAMKQLAPQIVAMVKQQAPEAPQEFWDEFEKTMTSMYDQIIKAMIPFYQKYLTLGDIQEIIAFYETPVGKKLAESSSKIAMESMPVAQKVAAQTMQQLMESAKAKGYIKQ